MSVDPVELLGAACPAVHRRAPAQLESRRLPITWSGAWGPQQVVRELSRGESGACWLGYHEDPYWAEAHPVVIRIGRSLAIGVIGDTRLHIEDEFEKFHGRGTYRGQTAVWSSYIHGADLGALYHEGIEVSWSVARCVYAAIRRPLAQLHDAGWIHGALRPERVRLAVTANRPFHPIKLCGFRGVRRVHDWGYAARNELAVIASLLCDLARHPDDTVNALLHDPEPGAIEVLADLIAERDQPIDELLADYLGGGDAMAVATARKLRAAIPHDASRDELGVLWKHVIALDPLLEPQAG